MSKDLSYIFDFKTDSVTYEKPSQEFQVTFMYKFSSEVSPERFVIRPVYSGMVIETCENMRTRDNSLGVGFLNVVTGNYCFKVRELFSQKAILYFQIYDTFSAKTYRTPAKYIWNVLTVQKVYIKSVNENIMGDFVTNSKLDVKTAASKVLALESTVSIPPPATLMSEATVSVSKSLGFVPKPQGGVLMRPSAITVVTVISVVILMVALLRGLLILRRLIGKSI